MVFNPEIHEVDPATGYHVFKGTGHRVGIDAAPIKRVTDETEYPKWVVPHSGHIRHHPVHGYITAPDWSDVDVARDGEVKVLVNNAEEEARAMAPPVPSAA